MDSEKKFSELQKDVFSSEETSVSQPLNKKRRTEESVDVHESNKNNPITILNGLQPGLIYNVENQYGPSNNRVFIVSVFYNGRKFIGIGEKKKLAKRSAAEKALESVIKENEEEDFSKDIVIADTDEKEIKKENKKLCSNIKSTPVIRAVMLLNQIYPKIEYCVEEIDAFDITNRFKAVICVNGETFFGMGRSKKKAKNAAALAALTVLSEKSRLENVVLPLQFADKKIEEEERAKKITKSSLLMKQSTSIE